MGTLSPQWSRYPFPSLRWMATVLLVLDRVETEVVSLKLHFTILML